MSLQVVVPVEGLLALVAFEGSVTHLLLMHGLVMKHGGAEVVCRVRHVQAAKKRHLTSGIVHVGHDGSSHCWEVVGVRSGVGILSYIYGVVDGS